MFHVRFPSARRRGPLARVIMALLAIVALLAGVALGFVALAVIVCGGLLFVLVNAIRTAMRPRSQATRPHDVLEGEFSVVGARQAKPGQH